MGRGRRGLNGHEPIFPMNQTFLRMNILSHVFGRHLLAVFGLSVMIGCSSSSPAQMESAEPAASEQMTADQNAVAVIDGEQISLEAFKTNFDRNGRVPSDSEPTLADYEDFLTRFVDFRLKVKEARRLELDQDPELKLEILQYRLQLARPYLMERNVFEPLVREMYDRRKEAVAASHILIRVEPTATPEDTLDAWNRLSAIRDSVVAGAAFGRLAAQFSEDPSAQGAPGTAGYQGSLGYFGGGRMVESFEDMAYNTPVGSVSPIFRSQFGYHILEVSDRRPMPADRALAHIMVREQGANLADQAATQSKLDSIRVRLERGESFADVAAELSEDQNSAARGGDLGRLAYDAGLPFAFRDAAYAIPEKGDWTGPVRTAYGYHFIQYQESFPLGSFEDEYEAMKNRVSQMPRTQAAQDAFTGTIRESVYTWVDTMRVEEWNNTMRMDSLIRWLAASNFESDDADAPFVRLADTTLTLSDYASYFRTAIVPATPDVRKRVMDVANKWLDEQAIEYEVRQLESRDQEFAATMQDFRDGLLLFRFMEQAVWNKASADSSRLDAHYQANKASYQFPDRIRIISYSSTGEENLKGFVDMVRQAGVEAAFEAATNDTTWVLRADTTYISEPTGSMFDEVFSLEEGQITDARTFNSGWIALHHAGVDPARGMTFEEARPEVINEVQGKLEEELMAELRERYGVSTYPDVLRQLVQ